MTLRSLAIPGAGAVSAARFQAFLELTKPRMVSLILVTTACGFWLASPARPDLWLLAATLVGNALAAGGTLGVNQVMERDIDSLMPRTRRRPLPEGRLQPGEALAFSLLLTAAGIVVLAVAANPLSAAITASVAVTYLLAYTPMKRRSALCTIVGAVPGALPPVAGWAAASGEVGMGAWVLFAIMFFWQIPHSLAIALVYREDYAKAGVKLLPTVEPDGRSTGRQIVLHGAALLAAGLLPSVAGLAGPAYFLVALVMGAWMLGASIRAGLRLTRESAVRLMLASFVYVPVVLIVMALDRVPFPA